MEYLGWALFIATLVFWVIDAVHYERDMVAMRAEFQRSAAEWMASVDQKLRTEYDDLYSAIKPASYEHKS